MRDGFRWRMPPCSAWSLRHPIGGCENILARRIPSGVVLDPFGGSGTTARVAAELNRRAVSIDLAYHDHAEKRTTHVQRQFARL